MQMPPGERALRLTAVTARFDDPPHNRRPERGGPSRIPLEGLLSKSTATAPAANETIAKFGYPDTLLADYDHWVVLLRPQQATLGAMVLACKEPAAAFSAISQAAFSSLASVTADIEATLGAAFAYDKVNYLMLMMVDPHVHFHVLPRYAEPRAFGGVSFEDPGWPAVPNLAAHTELDLGQRAALAEHLRGLWPTR